MSCERYNKALIEAAALGIAPAQLRAHLDTCVKCRQTLARQELLSNAIQIRMSSQAKVGIPANFTPRILARVHADGSPQPIQNWFEPRWGIAAVCALALVCVVVVRRNQQLPVSRSEPTLAAHVRPDTASADLHAHENSNRARPSLQRRSERLTVVRSPRAAGTPRQFPQDGQDVLLSGGERAALESYLRSLNNSQANAAFAAVESSPETRSPDVEAIEVSTVVLTPLPDLGSEELSKLE